MSDNFIFPDDPDGFSSESFGSESFGPESFGPGDGASDQAASPAFPADDLTE